MKKIIFHLLWVTCLFYLACNNKAEKTEVAEDTVTTAAPSSWYAMFNDSTGRIEMKKMETGGPDTLEAGAIIKYLNNINPFVKLEYIKTSNDTLYIKIPDANYLTQQMGSTGPTMYFAGAVYNLTELPGIKYVNIDFEEGDHAAPGVLHRESFNDN
jgi:hypothetical protein